MLTRLWAGWKKAIHVVGAFQSRLLLSVFYFLILMPYALFAKCTSDPLQLRRPKGDSNWVPWDAKSGDLAHSSKQY